jgi:hypothetical protein
MEFHCTCEQLFKLRSNGIKHTFEAIGVCPPSARLGQARLAIRIPVIGRAPTAESSVRVGTIVHGPATGAKIEQLATDAAVAGRADPGQ